MKHLRVALVMHDARPGGGQDRYGLELANRLAERHEVTLIAANAEQLATAVHFERVSLPHRPALVRGPLFAHRARHLVARRSWDVVHTIGGAFPGASVITAQFCQRGWRSAQDRWPSVLIPRVQRAYHRVLGRHTASYELRAARATELAGLIGVSRATLNEWEHWYRPAARVRAVIPNGVDPARFRPGDHADRKTLRNRLGLPPGATVLLLAGALVRKGIETALEMLVRLNEPSVMLVAVGDGPARRVLQLARALGVADRVRLVRHAPDIEVFYRGADVFVFPSRYEPFGMVVVEAWASGLPVVAAQGVGALEWATAGKHALVVKDPIDTEGFAMAVRRLLDDRELGTTLASAGRELASGLTWQRVVLDTEQVYAKVAGLNPRAATFVSP